MSSVGRDQRAGRGQALAASSPLWSISVASFAAAVLTWALQALAGRALGPASYAEFMVVWGLVFFEVGLLLGLQQEVTRAVTRARTSAEVTPQATDSTGAATSTTRLAVAVGGTGAVLILASAPLWGRHVVGPSWPWVTAAAAAAFLFYAFYNAVNGVLAGTAAWGDYAVSIAGEGLLRFVLVGIALAAGATLAGQSWGLAGAGLTWAVLSVRRAFRRSLAQQVPGRFPVLLRATAHAMVATGCSALMVAGFPVLLRATSSGPLTPEAGVVLAVVVATRAPLMLPLNAFSAVVLSRFVSARGHVLGELTRLAVPVLGLSVLGAGLGYLVGPFLLRVLYGPLFVVGGVLVATLVLAAGLLAVQTLSGSAVLAADAHAWYAGGWLISAAVSIAPLSLDASVSHRVALSLLAGPLAGLACNVVALTARRQRAS